MERLARKLRPVFFIGSALAVPVFFFSYAYALKLFVETLPFWLFLVIAASHVVVWIAASMLHDFQSERASGQRFDQ